MRRQTIAKQANILKCRKEVESLKLVKHLKATNQAWIAKVIANNERYGRSLGC